MHKNAISTATAPKSMIWRKWGEGLKLTGKGSKELACGRSVHVLVAIAYGRGVAMCIPYENVNGQFFAKFINDHFNLCFA